MKVSPYEKSGVLQALLGLLLESHDKLVEQLQSDSPNALEIRIAKSSVERIRTQYEEAQVMELDYGFIPREVNNESA